MRQTFTRTLPSGLDIPQLAYSLSPRSTYDAASLVALALRHDYRHLDLCAAPELAGAVGRGLRDADTTPFLTAGGMAAPRVLDQLGADSLDLYLVETAMCDDRRLIEDWDEAAEWLSAGLVRSLGTRRASARQLDLLAAEGIRPDLNQVPLSPVNPQNRLRARHDLVGIVTAAMKPMADWPQLLNHEAITTVAKRYRATPAQVVIRWHLQLGNVVLPSPVNPERLVSNAMVLDCELDGQDLGLLGRMAEGEGQDEGEEARK